MRRFSFLSSFLCLVVACSAGGGGGGGVDGGGGGPTTETGPGACSDFLDNDLDGQIDCLDSDCATVAECRGTVTDGGPPPDGFLECAGSIDTGDNLTAPVDIIWIVDSSGSMEDDATTVQANLDGFAADIEGRSIDFHVVLVSDRGFVTPSARFGTDPRFLFVDRGVGSNEAFDRALDQFPTYSAHLRPTATTHIIGVTDDDEDMGAGTFVAMMTALLGHGFTYHAIASPPGECPSFCVLGCSACAGGCSRAGGFEPAAAPGDQHWAAAAATGGMTFSICTSDWSGLFDTLAAAVAVAEILPCVFAIPDPPAGMSFDRDQVNVLHTPSGGTATPFRRVDTEAACGSASAWHYDDPTTPTSIILCPAACAAVTAGPGMVEIQLGCASLLI